MSRIIMLLLVATVVALTLFAVVGYFEPWFD
jgi:hypothetical protein